MSRPNEGMLSAYGIAGCGCGRCVHEVISKRAWPDSIMYPFIVCAECGNKRCPKSSWHAYKCTRANEFRQEPEEDHGRD